MLRFVHAVSPYDAESPPGGTLLQTFFEVHLLGPFLIFWFFLGMRTFSVIENVWICSRHPLNDADLSPGGTIYWKQISRFPTMFASKI